MFLKKKKTIKELVKHTILNPLKNTDKIKGGDHANAQGIPADNLLR